jgi:hypothetical protein
MTTFLFSIMRSFDSMRHCPHSGRPLESRPSSAKTVPFAADRGRDVFKDSADAR